jgi:hypothetical protein
MHFYGQKKMAGRQISQKYFLGDFCKPSQPPPPSFLFIFGHYGQKFAKLEKKNLGQTQRDLHDSAQFAMLMKISKIDVFTFCDITHWYSYETSILLIFVFMGNCDESSKSPFSLVKIFFYFEICIPSPSIHFILVIMA